MSRLDSTKKHASNPVRLEIERMRLRLSNQIFLTAAILSPTVLVVGITRAVITSWDPAFILHIGLVLCLCLMAWKREHIAHNVKSIALVSIPLIGGVSGAAQHGLLAPAILYLVLAPFFASILLGRRGALVTLGIVCSAFIGLGAYVTWSGRLPAWDIPHYMTSPIAWAMEFVVLFLVIAFVLVALEIFDRSLVKSLTDTYRHEKHLLSRNALLEKASDELRHLHEQAQVSLNENASMVKRLDLVIRQTIDAFTTATVHTDLYTAGHEKRTTDLSLVLGRRLGLTDDRLMGLELAARAHDIGQLKVPSEILLRPNALTELEFKFIQQHAEAGWEILRKIDFPWPVAEIVREHHENFDGTGYPSGLRGDAILLEARIIRVADFVEALSSHRPYRAACSREEVMARVAAGSGNALDPQVAAVCLEVLTEGYVFPSANG